MYVILLSYCILKLFILYTLYKNAGSHDGISQKRMEVAFLSINPTVERMYNDAGKSRKVKNG